MSSAALRQRETERDISRDSDSHMGSRLRALPRWRPRNGPRIVHGVVALAGLAAIVLAQLGVSVALADGAMEIKEIQSQTSEAQLHQQAMSEQLAALESPQQLATTAQGLGMVSSEQQHFLSMSTGAVTTGADALGQSTQALNSGGMLYVPNELVQSQVELSAETGKAAMAAQQEREEQGYPGMLEPVEGVAADD